MNKWTVALFVALTAVLIARPVYAESGKTNHFCVGNADHPGRKVCDNSSPDDYYEQFPQSRVDLERNERYLRNHQAFVCRQVIPSYEDGYTVREYIVTDPRDCR